jgi:hypothetical protein
MYEFRKMRNDIAHYNLLIGNDGEIVFYEKNKESWQKVNVVLIHNDLMQFASDIIMLMLQSLR